MRTAYKIVLTKTEKGYLVTVPDFNCQTEGIDIADAMYMARDAIGLMGMTMQDIGKIIPEPNSAAIKLCEGDIELYVDVDFIEYRKKHDHKKVKKTLSIPSWLNKQAKAEQINFSRVLEEALIKKLGLDK